MKIEEQVLSIEQAKHLQELGLDMSDAALCWVRYTRDRYGNKCEGSWHIDVRCYKTMGILQECEEIPTYTLQEILDKLPVIIFNNGKSYEINVRFDGVYNVSYMNVGEYAFTRDVVNSSLDDTYIEFSVIRVL